MAAKEDLSIQPLLDQHRSEAERLLNGMRAVVLLLLAATGAFYSKELPAAVNRVNVLLLVPIFAWTIGQWIAFRGRAQLPRWLTVANPLIDVTWITLLMGGYALAGRVELGLRSPMFLAYFAVLASRPITSSTRLAATTAALAVGEYAALSLGLLLSSETVIAASPVDAAVGHGLSPLDECAKVLLLAVSGCIAVYATAWQARLLRSYHEQARHRELLESALARAQLRSLELQLHPHFLFNTLNTITALLRSDARAAERVVAGLSELLRFSLRGAKEQQVSLERELELLRRYVEIQQFRFSDRLRVDLSVDPRARRALVPSFLLQPLVENSIHHGIAPRASGGSVRVLIEREGDTVLLTVTDDGIGAGAAGRSRRSGDGVSGASGGGVGLGNTRARLRHLYGDAHRFEAGARPEGGFEVHIEIPFRDAAESTSPAILEVVA